MKTVFITGSSKGIGKEAALFIAKNKDNVVVTYKSDKEGAEKTAKECNEMGAKVLVTKLDITDKDSLIKAFDKAKQEFGKVDVFINNAGILHSGKVDELEDQKIRDTIDVNLTNLIIATKEVIEDVDMIINIASGAGKTGYAGMSVYCASKFGVRGFTDALRKEYPDKKVYCVNPGLTKTAMTNFQGRPASDVGKVIFDTVQGKYPGWEVDVEAVLE